MEVGMSTVIDWLLEEENPSVRYFALRWLLGRPEEDPEARAARGAIMRSEPVEKILAAQQPEGYWDKPGPGYSRKYLSTVWQVQFLADLGADGVSGLGFRCAVNDKLPCAWGAVKSLRALAAAPPALRSPRVERAQAQAAEFLLSYDLSKADYPAWQGKISGEWFRFGFPLSYTSDVLEAALALVEAGYGADPRLRPGLALIRSKRGPDGRWPLKHSLNGKMWADIEQKGQPGKWVTLRALRVLEAARE
ncbi:MAG: hypothetical protein HY784_09275 [Chloroflexi bacterium]|nr:hypothetical protein [Chloroflexota bacterium]